MDLKDVHTQRELYWLRDRVRHLEGVPPQVQVGEMHIPRMIDKCHGLRRPHMRYRGMRLLGVVFPPWRIYLFQ
jgi:hypothetical protein